MTPQARLSCVHRGLQVFRRQHPPTYADFYTELTYYCSLECRYTSMPDFYWLSSARLSVTLLASLNSHIERAPGDPQRLNSTSKWLKPVTIALPDISASHSHIEILPPSSPVPNMYNQLPVRMYLSSLMSVIFYSITYMILAFAFTDGILAIPFHPCLPTWTLSHLKRPRLPSTQLLMQSRVLSRLEIQVV
jgi:hypothetical protein